MKFKDLPKAKQEKILALKEQISEIKDAGTFKRSLKIFKDTLKATPENADDESRKRYLKSACEKCLTSLNESEVKEKEK